MTWKCVAHYLLLLATYQQLEEIFPQFLQNRLLCANKDAFEVMDSDTQKHTCQNDNCCCYLSSSSSLRFIIVNKERPLTRYVAGPLFFNGLEGRPLKNWHFFYFPEFGPTVHQPWAAYDSIWFSNLIFFGKYLYKAIKHHNKWPLLPNAMWW